MSIKEKLRKVKSTYYFVKDVAEAILIVAAFAIGKDIEL